MAVPKDPKDIEIAEPFVSLFPIDPATRDLVAVSMRENGYDLTKPVLAWRDAFGEHGRTVVVDGHTRRAVAIDLKLPTIPVTVRRFDDADAAIAAAIGEQAQRRNLTPSQLAVHVLTLLDRFDNGFPGQGARNDLYGRSAKQLGEMIGVTSRTIERARQLIAFGDDELLAQVKAGEVGLKTAIERGKRDDDPPPEPAPEPAVEPEPTPDDGDARKRKMSASAIDTLVGRYVGLRDLLNTGVVHGEARKGQLLGIEESLVAELGRDGFESAVAEREGEMDANRAEPEPEPFIRPRPPKREPRIGEPIRKGVGDRVRDAQNALRLMWWEFEAELPDRLKASEDADTRAMWIDVYSSMVDEESSLAGILDAMRGLVVEARGGANLLRKIEAMRNTAGRTPAEAAMFAAKADELEAEGLA